MHSRTTKLTLVGLLVISLLTLGGCQSQPQSTASGDKTPVRIGFVVPLTGDLANVGGQVRQAVEMAVEDINNSGGIQGRNLELIIEDGQCDAKQGTLVGSKLIHINQVPAIVGALCSGPTMSMAPIAEEAGVVVLAYASSNPQITDMGDYIFRDFPSDTFQGKYATEFVYNNLGVRRAAILAANEEYARGLAQEFKKSFASLGGQIVSEQQFSSDTKDLRTELSKIKDSSAELIYAPSYTNGAIILMKQLKEMEMNMTLFGPESYADTAIFESAGDAAEGVLWTTINVNVPQWFKDKMQQKYGTEEIMLAVPQAYDAVNIIAKIMNEVSTNPQDIKDALYKIDNYAGISGDISFDQNGDLEKATYSVMTYKNGQTQEYK